MKVLKFVGNEITPSVHMDPETGLINISGKSVPEEPDVIYDPILEWLAEYCDTPCSLTSLTFNFDCFNIASSKRILFILYKLNELVDKDQDVTVTWCYKENDDDMYEIGMDFAFMVTVPFKFVEYEPNQAELVSV